VTRNSLTTAQDVAFPFCHRKLFNRVGAIVDNRVGIIADNKTETHISTESKNLLISKYIAFS
jgi:hypothetical protein